MASSGTLPTDTWLFSGVVVGTAVIVTGLNFFLVLVLGPSVEHLLMIGRCSSSDQKP